MAWNLRQFFEGDRVLTVSNVAGENVCWVSGGSYVPNTIAAKFNGVERVFSSGVTVSFGIGVIQIPSDIFVGPSTTIQVYAVCEDLPDSKTETLTARPVNFQVTNTVLKACNPQVILNSSISEYVRFFLFGDQGDYFNAKLNGVNLAMSGFGYAPGDSGNISSSNGNFSRPTTVVNTASIISNTPVSGTNILRVQVLSNNYFTARLGYIELIFTGISGVVQYNNYLTNTEIEVSIGNYSVNDIFEIESQPDKYTIRRITSPASSIIKTKPITYAVSGGTVTPSTSTIGTPVAWTVPTTAGSYVFTVNVGESLKFQKTVQMHSCADAVADNFNGSYNQVFSGNVATNDIICVGENTYFTLVAGSVTGGTLIFNQNGTFVFTPTNNFNGLGTFSYNILCGSSFADAEIVDTTTVGISYFDACNGVVANWVQSAVRCQACVEQKQETDTNANCTGNTPRWVANPGGTACNRLANQVPTGEKRCQNCVNQREVQDLNSCSSTYLEKEWVADPQGTICSDVATWSDNGVTDCQNCNEVKQQTDINPCSGSYNTTRFVANSVGTKCVRTPILNPSGEYVCINCVEYERRTDSNPCSPTYNQIVNVPSFVGGICNTNAVWSDTGITKCEGGKHFKEQESTNPCSEERERWIETGLPNCNCTGYIRYRNLCEDDEILGVVVTKDGVQESNRLLSHANGVITFLVDQGTAKYKAVVMRSSGLPVIIKETQICTL